MQKIMISLREQSLQEYLISQNGWFNQNQRKTLSTRKYFKFFQNKRGINTYKNNTLNQYQFNSFIYCY